MFVSGTDSTYNQIIGRVVLTLQCIPKKGWGRDRDGKIILSETQKYSFRHSRTFLHCYRCDNTPNGNYVE